MDEVFEKIFLPATEDNVEEVKTPRETKHEIPEDATSVEVENTLLEAVDNAADRIFLYCDAVDMKEPLLDDFLGEDLDDASESEQEEDDNPYP